MAHATLLGGRRGGGERDVQTTLDYELSASMFPATAHYVALGHLHRQQEIPGPCPIFYSGSPLAIDFGEEANDSVALVVTAAPGIRADTRPVPVTGGRRLRTLRGTLDEGLEFLYDPHRLNVATSRAKAMAVVVASSDLIRVACKTPRQMYLVNALCRTWKSATPESKPGD